MSIKGQGHSDLKSCFSKQLLHPISNESVRDHRHENLYKWARSHVQDGRQAHIWSKHVKTVFSNTNRAIALKLVRHTRLSSINKNVYMMTSG